MFAAPVPPPDSTTSGYSVPWTRKSIDSPFGDDRARGLLEAADELASDRLALLLGIGHAGERIEELPGRVDDLEPNPVAATKSRSTCSASPARSRPWSTNTQVS